MTAASPLLAVLALAAVIGLILAARHAAPLLPGLARVTGRGAVPRGGLVLEQVLALDARRRLLLVRCGGRRVVLLTGGPRDVVVGWTDAPGDEAP
jgi:flagellar protein FliO/FliZ